MVDPPHHYEPAFSLTANSSLLNLFTRVASGGRQLTVVCGAGISLDCGFPTWRALVNTMCEQIKDDDIRQLIQDDSVRPDA